MKLFSCCSSKRKIQAVVEEPGMFCYVKVGQIFQMLVTRNLLVTYLDIAKGNLHVYLENKEGLLVSAEQTDEKIGRDRIFSNARDESGPYVNVPPPSYKSDEPSVDPTSTVSKAVPSSSSSDSSSASETVTEALPQTPTPEPAPEPTPTPEPVCEPTLEKSPTPQPTPSPEPRPATPMEVKIERSEKMRQDPYAHLNELADSYLDGRGSDGRLAVVNNGNWQVAPKSSKIYS